MNGRLRLVESLLDRAEERKVAAHPIERGGRFIDCGICRAGGLRAGLDLARICLADLAEVDDRPRRGRRPAVPARAGRHRSSGAGLPGQPVCRLGDQRGEVLRDGLGADAGRRGPGADLRQDRPSRGAPTAVVGVLEARKPPPPAVVAKIAEACRVAPVGRDAAGRADGQPGGRAPGRRPIGRDGLAQARRSSASTCPASSSAHGTAPLPPVAARRPGRDRPDQRRDPLRRPRRPLRHRRRRQPGGDRPEGPLVRPRTTTASRSPRSSPATTTTSTPSIPTCSARPRSSSRTSRPAASTPSARWPRTSWSGRSSPELASRHGPRLAISEPNCDRRSGLRLRLARPGPPPRGRSGSDIAFEAVPFAGVIGRVGATGASVEAGGIDLARVDGVLVRMMPPGSLEQVVFRMDALHRLAARGRPGPEPAAGGRGGGRQVPDAGPARRGGAARAADLGGRIGRRRAGGVRGAGGRRRGQAAVRLGRAGAGPRLGPRAGPADVPDPRTAGGRALRPADVRHPGHDLRAFVLGGRVARRRSAATRPAGDWRTNVALGGRPERVPARRRRPSARPAARPGPSGRGWRGSTSCPTSIGASLVVLEVNAVPGWRALARATGIDVAAAILADLRGR